MYEAEVKAMTATERHYTPKEVADMWQVHIQTVHRTFRDIPGVLHLGLPSITGRRTRETLRIPASVLERFHEQRSSGFRPEIKSRRRRVE